jgi:hypothetical protein
MRRGHWVWGLVAVALLALTLGHQLQALVPGGQPRGSAALLVNPCTGESITLREPTRLLPYLSPEQAGSRAVSVNAVGLSGVGSKGTDYLPLGTGKIVFTLTNGTLDFAVGSDLALVGRGNQGHDFNFHGLAHFKVGLTSGLSGSGLAMQARCE